MTPGHYSTGVIIRRYTGATIICFALLLHVGDIVKHYSSKIIFIFGSVDVALNRRANQKCFKIKSDGLHSIPFHHVNLSEKCAPRSWSCGHDAVIVCVTVFFLLF